MGVRGEDKLISHLDNGFLVGDHFGMRSSLLRYVRLGMSASAAGIRASALLVPDRTPTVAPTRAAIPQKRSARESPTIRVSSGGTPRRSQI